MISLDALEELGILVILILALVFAFVFSDDICAYDQFEGYDLANPYPTVNNWYRVDDQRREDMRDAEERQRYDEMDNHNPYPKTRRFDIYIEELRYE